jgi:hypothetical protein
MSYPTHDTDWAESQLGNFWRRVNGAALIVGRDRVTKLYWASIDHKYIDDMFNSLKEAQLGVEKEHERNENNFLPPCDYEN